MKIGTIVKVIIPYKSGEKRIGNRYKYGKVVKVYPNFILIRFDCGYLECYREEEIIIC